MVTNKMHDVRGITNNVLLQNFAAHKCYSKIFEITKIKFKLIKYININAILLCSINEYIPECHTHKSVPA